jgi:hypothetical protein
VHTGVSFVPRCWAFSDHDNYGNTNMCMSGQVRLPEEVRSLVPGGESGRQGGLTRTCRFRLETTNRGYETGGADEWLRSSGLLKKICLTRGRFRLVSSVCSMDSLLVDVRSSGRQGVGGLTQNYLCSDGIVRDLPSGDQEVEGKRHDGR